MECGTRTKTPAGHTKTKSTIALWFSVLGCCFTILSARPNGASAYDLGLIGPQDLARDPSAWVVLDARPRSHWLSNRIPGALSFSWVDYTRTDAQGARYRIWPLDQLVEVLGQMGIDEKTPVVVYGDGDKSWGEEGWICWVLTWLGHQGPIRLLPGGVDAWSKADLPTEWGLEPKKRPRSHYTVHLRPEVGVETEALVREDSGGTLVDVRSDFEWQSGHLSGAVHIPWRDFLSKPDLHPLSPTAVARLLEGHDVVLGKPVVYYCTGGVRSAYAWFVHELAGLSDAKNYEGGMEAWKIRERVGSTLSEEKDTAPLPSTPLQE